MVKYHGEDPVKWAVRSLPRNRKLFVLNIAKKLLIKIPNDLLDPQKVLTIGEI
jgi:hypothetical protein